MVKTCRDNSDEGSIVMYSTTLPPKDQSLYIYRR